MCRQQCGTSKPMRLSAIGYVKAGDLMLSALFLFSVSRSE